MYDREPIANWSRGRLALLGDAAHPMLQYLAQGACQALEDAVVLADALAAHDDPAAAFLAYRDARYLRTARVQYSARLFGEIWHVGDVGATLRDAMLGDPRATTTSATSSGCTAGARDRGAPSTGSG